MSVRHKLHMHCFLDVMELIIIGSLLALVGDTVWVFADIYKNGLSIVYSIIATCLVLGTIVTILAFIKHHNTDFKAKLHTYRQEKHNIVRLRNKHRRYKYNKKCIIS